MNDFEAAEAYYTRLLDFGAGSKEQAKSGALGGARGCPLRSPACCPPTHAAMQAVPLPNQTYPPPPPSSLPFFLL